MAIMRVITTLYSMPSMPSAMRTFANSDTCRSSFFHVSSPTSTACLSSALTSAPRARRREGDEVDKRIDSSVSSCNDRVERFDEPINVMKGALCGLIGDTQMPDFELDSLFEHTDDNGPLE
jgi:hypothetical protein